MKDKTSKYHHGDLRSQLIQQATMVIESEGVEGLSMRKLGEIIGVSRTALYHHFKNKQDLLAALAESGFATWKVVTNQILQDEKLTEIEKLHTYVRKYLIFSHEQKSTYELMFGNAIWKNELDTESLKQTAYSSFSDHLDLVKHWQNEGIVSKSQSSLRLAQVPWSTLHGMAKLYNDGIYVDMSHLDELSESIVKMFCGK